MEPRPFERGNLVVRPYRQAPRVAASMEPRPFERGNNQLRRARLPNRRVLQWSHVLSNVETSCSRHSLHERRRLQWSHVLSNVETGSRRQETRYTMQASMEPRPFERGNQLAVPVRSSSEVGFNGATSFRTWKPIASARSVPAVASLQWSHVLSNVETVYRSQKCLTAFRHASMEPRPFERGNDIKDREKEFPFKVASMEPRPFERGNAAHSRERKHSTGASMEPRPFERGNLPDCSTYGASFGSASMEPRPFERGNPENKETEMQNPFQLQWSHVLSNVETVARRGYCRRAGRASMEPRPFERGNRR